MTQITYRVLKSKRPKAPQRRSVYEGPVGRCPCCDKPTEVRIGSTLGEPARRGWIVPVYILESIYRAVATRTKFDHKKQQWYVTDPSEYDATRRKKLFFVDGGDALAGPFGPLGLTVFLRSNFKETSQNTRIYTVITTHRALDRIRNSPFTAPPDDTYDLDEPTDLF